MVAKGLGVNKNFQEDNIECEFLKGTMELWVGEGVTTFKRLWNETDNDILYSLHPKTIRTNK